MIFMFLFLSHSPRSSLLRSFFPWIGSIIYVGVDISVMDLSPLSQVFTKGVVG